MRLLLRFAAAAALVSCGGSPTAADADIDALTVSGRVADPAGARTTVRVELPQRTEVVTDDMYHTEPGSGFAYARISGLPRAGSMLVTVVVTASPSDTIGFAALTYPLLRGRAYGVDVSRRPAGAFPPMGPGSVRKFALRGSASGSTDSLWVYVVNGVPCRGCVY